MSIYNEIRSDPIRICPDQMSCDIVFAVSCATSIRSCSLVSLLVLQDVKQNAVEFATKVAFLLHSVSSKVLRRGAFCNLRDLQLVQTPL